MEEGDWMTTHEVIVRDVVERLRAKTATMATFAPDHVAVRPVWDGACHVWERYNSTDPPSSREGSEVALVDLQKWIQSGMRDLKP